MAGGASTDTVTCAFAGLTAVAGALTETTGLSAAQTLPLQISPSPQAGTHVPEAARQIPSSAQTAPGRQSDVSLQSPRTSGLQARAASARNSAPASRTVIRRG